MSVAGKHLDPVLGIDIHIIQPPGPVPPLPIPHPFIGLVLDPFDYAPWIGATVLVNGLPRCQASTSGYALPPHIPIGGIFVKPPGNELEVFMGSSTVTVDGEPFTYLGLPALTCSDIGMPPPPHAGKKSAPKSMFLPTSVVLCVPMGAPVLVGGSPTISLTALMFKAALAGLGKLKKLASKTKRVKAWSARLHRRAAKFMDRLGIPASWRNRVHRAICAVTGHPVDVATGKLFTEQMDFELPGPIPLRWRRVWFSTSVYRGPLGHGWHHDHDLALLEGDGVVAIRLADGRGLASPTLAVGESYFDRHERATLTRDARGYVLCTRDQLRHRFGPSPSGDPIQRLIAVEDISGNGIRFRYDRADRLVGIVDSGGRELTVVCDDLGRIVEIRGPDPEQPGGSFTLVRYAYDREGRLLDVHDALGPSARYEWNGTLLTREIGSGGLEFQFEWDREGPDARCVRTWGEGRLLERTLRYHEGMTEVTDSLGAVTRYTVDEGLAVAIEDPLGNLWQREYGEYSEILAEIDPLGRKRCYVYDERGNLCERHERDGSVLRLAWTDDDRLVGAIDPNGGWWQWRHDERGRVIERLDPAGGRRSWVYQGRWLIATVDGQQRPTQFGWDAQGNVTGIRSISGATEQWTYDVLGRPITHVDARGRTQRRHYDRLGRLIRVEDPDGRIIEARWDGHDNLIWTRVGDPTQPAGMFEASFEYLGRGKLARRRVGGEQLSFVYDREERLYEIIDALGRRHRFEHDTAGSLISETDVGGATRRYVRDAVGRITRRISASQLATEYTYDGGDRATQVRYPDGGEARFAYRGDGMLCRADNDAIEIELERDALGRVLVERQGEHWIAMEYDVEGRRTRLRSSLGADRRLGWDERGQLARLEHHSGAGEGEAAGDAWICEFERDVLGVELERRMPGGLVSRWTRDGNGNPQRHQLLLAGHTLRTRDYEWRPGLRLERLSDDIGGEERFGHDAHGALTWARRGEQLELRLRDLLRNPFESELPQSREYGPCGELYRDGDTRYRYDLDGQRIEKRTADGKLWRYEWNAAGQLSAVVRPDERRVEFFYDALGRRVAKRFDGVQTRWLWDGNVPLHEWTERIEAVDLEAPFVKPTIAERLKHAELITGPSPRGPPTTTTWIFGEGFEPIARLHRDRQLAIVCDHRFVPLTAVDTSGEVVWQGSLDLAGRVRMHVGEQDAVPFRFAGQYEDAETGLYYNRFRYYDPSSGSYLSRDPGGLLNGLSVYAYVSDPHRQIDPFGLNPADIALGLQNAPVTFTMPGGQTFSSIKENALGDFASNPVGDNSVRASAWPGFDGVHGTPVDQLGPKIRGAMDDATRIHFNLEGMSNVADIAANPDPSRFHPPSTNWELATVLSDPDLKKKTTFYDGPGKKVPCPG